MAHELLRSTKSLIKAVDVPVMEYCCSIEFAISRGKRDLLLHAELKLGKVFSQKTKPIICKALPGKVRHIVTCTDNLTFLVLMAFFVAIFHINTSTSLIRESTWPANGTEVIECSITELDVGSLKDLLCGSCKVSINYFVKIVTLRTYLSNLAGYNREGCRTLP